jgi:excisionase family DNA binding protein
VNKTYSPKQVARAIGVSESSLKRWCDQGLIHTVRTAGGHRRLMLPDVLEFIKSQGRDLVEPEVIGLPALTRAGVRTLERARQDLINALVAGNETASRQIVFDLIFAEHRLCDICDEVIGDAFHEVGDLWDCGTVEVYQERRACEIIVRVMLELRQFYRDPSTRAPLAVGAAPAGDPYTLPTTMAELVLRENGWRAVSLGSNLPFNTLAAAVRDQHPQLFWLSVSSIDNEDEFVTGFNEFVEQARQMGTAVLIGGRALTEPIRKRLNFTSFCDRMRNLEEFAQTYRRGASPSPSELSAKDNEN